ncbi:protein CIMAP1C [Sminthopsis crassicaudata]|uniref:protein CIMAP1C n=1 Tax=Sminthopsis crassicaudata TaxID=9301 RepID=UPI003D68D51C
MGTKKLTKLKKIEFSDEGLKKPSSPRSQRRQILQTPVLMALMKSPGPGRYLLPTCIGYQGHDVSMHRAPAYTLHTRHSDKCIADTYSPGPCYYWDPRLTRFGMSSCPQVPMEERIPNLRVWPTPAPCTYFWEKVHPPGERRSPQYSIGYRYPYGVSFPNPAPNHYPQPSRLGYGTPVNHSAPCYGFGSTSARGDINKDLYRSPGPAVYDRPEPSVYKTRSPSHTMGKPFGFPREETNYPGPGSHDVEAVTANKPQAPSFSMGVKHSPHLTPLIVDIED